MKKILIFIAVLIIVLAATNPTDKDFRLWLKARDSSYYNITEGGRIGYYGIFSIYTAYGDYKLLAIFNNFIRL